MGIFVEKEDVLCLFCRGGGNGRTQALLPLAWRKMQKKLNFCIHIVQENGKGGKVCAAQGQKCQKPQGKRWQIF